MGRPKKGVAELRLPTGLEIVERPSHVELLSRRRSKWELHAKGVLAATGSKAFVVDMKNVPEPKKTVAAIRVGVTKELREVHKVTKPLKAGYDAVAQKLYLWLY